MAKIIIAIDGFASCGKSTVAKTVAKFLNYIYIDSGAMYRAVTLYCLQNNININNENEIIKALSDIHIHFIYNPQLQYSETFLNDQNVEEFIRSMTVSEHVSKVSTVHEVRELLVNQQQKLGTKRGIVMDGRDIGTVVFPDAELKIFMNGDINIRAQRRYDELKNKVKELTLEGVRINLLQRDLIDSTRLESPLKPANDAILLDNSLMDYQQQFDFVLALAQQKLINTKRNF